MASCVTCAMPPHSPTSASPFKCVLPRGVCQSEVCSYLPCQEELCAGPEVQGGRGGKCWEERDPLPGKHTSTCENMFPFREMCPGPWAGKFPGRPGMHRSPPFPLAGNLCCLWKAGGLQGEHASPDLCHGGETCFSGWRGSEVQGACDFLAVAQASPCIVWCGQGSLYVNTSLPGSPGGGVGRRQRQEGTGFWGTKA